MAAIGGTLDEARAGRGGVLFLIAEAGLGKTTMLDHARHVAGPAFVVGGGHGDATEVALPFGIFSQARDDLGSKGEIEPGGSPIIVGTDARSARFYSVLRFLQRKSVEPVLVLLDDLHWADPDSLSLLSFLGRRIGMLPVALIGTLRPWPPNALDRAQRLAMSDDARIERLNLLSEEASGALLVERVGGSVPPEQVTRAFSLTSGNPLLLEHAAIQMARGKDVPESTPVVDNSEADLLLSRFADGVPAQRRYADAAAIFGTTFRPALAAELAGLSGREAEEALEGLFASGVVRAKNGGAEFAHPLLRQTLYERMPAPVRSGKHATAFRALLARGVDPAEAAEHAMRADLAGDPQAIAVLERAGRLGGDPEGALAEFEQAVNVSPPFAPGEGVNTLLEAVYVSWPTVGPARATPLAARAKELARDASEDVRIRAETAWAFSAFVGGDPQGIEVIEEAARRAEADPGSDIGNFPWALGAIGLHGNVAKWMERYDEAERAFKVGMVTAGQINLPVAIASLAVMHAHTLARTGPVVGGPP